MRGLWRVGSLGWNVRVDADGEKKEALRGSPAAEEDRGAFGG